MARENQKLIALVLVALRVAHQRLGIAGVVGVLAIAAAAIFFWGVPLVDSPGSTSPAKPQPTATSTENAPGESPATQPVLTEIGRDRYRSPAGLVYTRGSIHGHRLKHVMHHATDDPDRGGPHGVFDANDQNTILLLIDAAYQQALSGRDTQIEREGQRTVYDVDLGRRIGYVGGEVGARRGFPAAKGLRLVVDDDRLITAFPITR